MNKKDILLLFSVLIVILLFIFVKPLYTAYEQFNTNHGMITSFLKFALLATFGEMLGLRIRTGVYNRPGFGIAPRAVVWGFLGLTIKIAFVVFATGVPLFLDYLGIEKIVSAMQNTSLSPAKLVGAFSISVLMNIFYAPVMMTFHKITDTHILQNKGKLSALLIKIDMGQIMSDINWHVQWHFVFKKTIPLFWIPAHTITFLLPPDFQVLFAALLSVALGLILAVAGLKSNK